MKHRSFVFLTIAITTTLFAQTTNDKPILGFTAANAAKEHALEALFDAKMNRDNLRNWMQRLSARPHHLGSDYDRQNAEFIASLFMPHTSTLFTPAPAKLYPSTARFPRTFGPFWSKSHKTEVDSR